VVDGRAELGDEIATCDEGLIAHIAGTMSRYLDDDVFQDTLVWHLPPDEAGQARLSMLRRRLEAIARLAHSK
jgi:hypothetical protein